MAWGRSHWSNSANQTKLFVIDAKVAVVILIGVLRPSWATLYFALAVTAFYCFLAFKMKMTDRVFIRWLAAKVIGNERNTKT